MKKKPVMCRPGNLSIIVDQKEPQNINLDYVSYDTGCTRYFIVGIYIV